MTLAAPAIEQSVPDEPRRGAGFRTSYRRFWQRCLVFSGRAGRAEYWWAALGNAVAVVALAILLGLAVAVRGALDGSPLQTIPAALAGVLAVVLGLLLLALVVPSFAVSVRRLHDADLSGWFVLVLLVPSVGLLILLVLHVLPPGPRGSRYDRGAAGTTSWQAAPVPPPADGPVFDAWPATPGPATTPVATAPAPQQPDRHDAVRAAWSALGAVTPLEPPMSAPPAWRAHRYLRVTRPGAASVVATDGLRSSEGATALGPGAEVYLADGAPGAEPAPDWRFAAVAAVARRIAATGVHLPSELEQYGTLSMALAGIDAPAGLRTAEGGLGVLLGLPHPAVPGQVVTPDGEVQLVSITPLTPDELQQILDGGAAARRQVAGRLAALPPAVLAARSGTA